LSIRTKRGLVAATIGLALVATPLALTTGAVGAETTTTKVARAKANTFDLQILSFNDFHGHLEATDSPVSSLPDACGEEAEPGCTPPVGGIEYLAGHVRDLRAEQPERTLTVAAGDLIGGSTFLSGLFQDQPSIEAMNELELDVSSVGNHEFDEGTAELKRMIKGGCHPEMGCFKDLDGKDIEYGGTDFPYLGANVVKKSDGKPFLRSRWVKEIKGKKIGFIGMTLEGTPLLVNPAGIDTVEFKDEVATARKNVKVLNRQGVKAIVVLVHEGGFQSAGISGCADASGPIMDIADRMPAAVDAIISGHTHNPYICKVADPQGKKRLVTSAASFGQVLTEMHLKINRRTGEVARGKSWAKNILVTRDVKKVRSQSNLLAFWKSLSDVRGDEVVGTVKEDITGDSNTCRCEETPMADLLADAILWGTEAPETGGADLALMNVGGVRAELLMEPSGDEAAGEVTYREAYNVAPFGNLLTTMNLSGQQLYDLLNQQYQPGVEGRRPMLALGVSEGVTYQWEWTGTQPAANTQPGAGTTGGRVVPGSLKIDGVAVDGDAIYRVATLNFLANGGDGFTVFTEGTDQKGGAEDLANLVDFLEANPGLTAPADRVSGL
jgi:5'-nucleotidase